MNYRRLALLLLLTLVMNVGCSSKPEQKLTSFTSARQLNSPAYTIGVGTGTAASFNVAKSLPKAKTAEFYALSGFPAVQLGKIDAFADDRVQMKIAMDNGLSGVKILPDVIGDPVKIAVGISRKTKIPGLKGKLNEFLAGLKESGTLDDMYERWAVKADYVMPEIPVPSEPSIKLKVGTTGVVMPYSYYEGNKLTGYDIELARRFALSLGAELEFRLYDYGGAVTALVAGDIDCVMANLNVTAEREEKIDFSDVTHTEETALMVRDNTQN